MSSLAATERPYDRLMALPDNRVGEIVGGRLYTQPRPAGRHAAACTSLAAEIHLPYQRGRGGPGSWWIIVEPALHFVRDTEVLVPDIAGWLRERLPQPPRGHRFEVVPDWVCEVLSPATVKKDRGVPRHGLTMAGGPAGTDLRTFALHEGRWTVVGPYNDQDVVSVAPFTDLHLELTALWLEAGE